MNLGLVGTCISTNIAYVSAYLVLELYTFYQTEVVMQARWSSWSPETQKCFFPFIKYAVPACLMLLLDWWSFELIPIISGRIGVKELFVSSILSNIDLLGEDL